MNRSNTLNSLVLLELLRRAQDETQRNSSLADLLAPLVASATRQATNSAGSKRPPDAKQGALESMRLEAFCRKTYLPGKNHAPAGPTAELALCAIQRFSAALGREATIADLRPRRLDRFREFMAQEIATGRIRAETGNKHLRHLRAVANYAIRKRLIKAGRVPPCDFFVEDAPHEVTAWRPEELQRLEAVARSLSGSMPNCQPDCQPTIAAATWWTAWLLCISRIGCRVAALMLSERTDFSVADSALLLRRETQKQKRDQRLLLPPRAAQAVAKLLQAHGEINIFPWPFDPPTATGKRKFRILTSHFERLLVTPAGLKLAKGVKTRQFRRTVATLVDEAGGNAQELLGHSSPKTTERYKDRKRKPLCRQALFVPEVARQSLLF